MLVANPSTLLVEKGQKVLNIIVDANWEPKYLLVFV